jgi:hypothetical protein
VLIDLKIGKNALDHVPVRRGGCGRLLSGGAAPPGAGLADARDVHGTAGTAPAPGDAASHG